LNIPVNTAQRCLCAGDWTGDNCSERITDELQKKVDQLLKLIPGIIVQDVTGYINTGDTYNLDALKHNYDVASAAVVELQKRVNTLRSTAHSIGSQNADNLAQINKVKQGFATKAEIDSLKALLDDIMSSSPQ